MTLDGFAKSATIFSVYLLFIALFSSTTGVAIATSLLTLSGVLCFRRELKTVPSLPVFWPIVALIAAIVLSAVFAKNYGSWKPVWKIRYFAMYFLLLLAFLNFPQLRRGLGLVGIALCFLFGLVALLQFTGVYCPLYAFGLMKVPPPVIPESGGRFFHARGLLHHHNPFAFGMLMLFWLMTASGLANREGNLRKWYWIAAAVCVAGILMSGSRSSWIALFGSGVLIAVTVARRHWKAFLGAGLALVLVAVAVAPLRARLFELRPGKNQERLRLWEISYRLFLESPVFGQGFHLGFDLNKDRYMTPEEKANPTFPVDPHSMYFDLLGTTGLVGILALLWFFADVLRRYYSALKRAAWTSEAGAFLVGMLGAFYAYMVGGFFDSYIFKTNMLLGMLFFLALGQSVVLSERGVVTR